MKRSLLILAFGLALAQAAPDETARLNAWFEARFEEQLAFSPIQQTFLGRKSNAIDEFTSSSWVAS